MTDPFSYLLFYFSESAVGNDAKHRAMRFVVEIVGSQLHGKGNTNIKKAMLRGIFYGGWQTRLYPQFISSNVYIIFQILRTYGILKIQQVS